MSVVLIVGTSRSGDPTPELLVSGIERRSWPASPERGNSLPSVLTLGPRPSTPRWRGRRETAVGLGQALWQAPLPDGRGSERARGGREQVSGNGSLS